MHGHDQQTANALDDGATGAPWVTEADPHP